MRCVCLTGEVSCAATWAGLVLEVLEGTVGFSVHTFVSGRLLPSASSPSASGYQVEYLYSLVYQALDFISGKK